MACGVSTFMNRLSLLFFLCSAAALHAAELKPTRAGIEISAGSLGAFTLTYPEFSNQANSSVHKVIEVNAANGTATVRYEGGVRLQLRGH